MATLKDYFPSYRKEDLSPLAIELIRSSGQRLDLVVTDKEGRQVVQHYDLSLDYTGFNETIKQARSVARLFRSVLTEDRGYKVRFVRNGKVRGMR